MKVLLDHNLPKRLRFHLRGHEISTTREMGWETLANGRLLKAATDVGYQVFISIDKKIEHEQNLQALPLPVVVINAPSNALPALIPFAPFLLSLLSGQLERSLYVVEPTGDVHWLAAPRQ